MKKSAPKKIDWGMPRSERRKGQRVVSVGWPGKSDFGEITFYLTPKTT